MANQLFAGFVYNNAGVAIQNATVDLYDRNTTTPSRANTTSDASGYWAISHATQGRFDVQIVSGTTTRRRKYDDSIQLETLEVAVFRLRNPADTFEYDIVPAAITASRQLNLPLLTATDTIAVLAMAQTFLTGVKTFNSSILAIRNPADTFSYTIVASAITAARNLTIPLTTVDDTFVVLTLAQTLANKTLTAPTIGATDWANAIHAHAAANSGGQVGAADLSGLGTGVATFLGTPSSANLAAAVTDETGSGLLVFGTSPTLVTPALGTPASGVMTNVTGIPAAAVLAGSLGAGAYVISTSLQAATIELGHATDTTLARVSAGVISVEGVEVTALGNAATGTGSIVRATSPTLVTPALGTPASGVLTNCSGYPAATDALSGIAELATTAETSTGTDAARTVTPDGLAGSVHGEVAVEMVVTEFATDVPAIGDGKFYFHIDSKLNGMNLVRVHASAITAGTTGTMDIQLARLSATLGTPADMLSTKITIDSTEIGSDTAAVAAVIDAANDDVSTNQWIRVDLDAVQTTKAKGLIVTLGFRLP